MARYPLQSNTVGTAQLPATSIPAARGAELDRIAAVCGVARRNPDTPDVEPDGELRERVMSAFRQHIRDSASEPQPVVAPYGRGSIVDALRSRIDSALCMLINRPIEPDRMRCYINDCCADVLPAGMRLNVEVDEHGTGVAVELEMNGPGTAIPVWPETVTRDSEIRPAPHADPLGAFGEALESLRPIAGSGFIQDAIDCVFDRLREIMEIPPEYLYALSGSADTPDAPTTPEPTPDAPVAVNEDGEPVLCIYCDRPGAIRFAGGLPECEECYRK